MIKLNSFYFEKNNFYTKLIEILKIKYIFLMQVS